MNKEGIVKTKVKTEASTVLRRLRPSSERSAVSRQCSHLFRENRHPLTSLAPIFWENR